MEGTCPHASELPVIPLLPVLPPSCSFAVPSSLPIPRDTLAGDTGTRHSALQGSNTDGDILRGTQGYDIVYCGTSI